MRVHYIPASDLRIGDLVIPDHGQPRKVAGQQADTAAAYVRVQYAGIPGCTTTYPARMNILISTDDWPNA